MLPKSTDSVVYLTPPNGDSAALWNGDSAVYDTPPSSKLHMATWQCFIHRIMATFTVSVREKNLCWWKNENCSRKPLIGPGGVVWWKKLNFKIFFLHFILLDAMKCIYFNIWSICAYTREQRFYIEVCTDF